MPSNEQHDIVIIGGGAAGLALAARLGRHYKQRQNVSVLLIDQQLTHVWKPLLHEVAAGTFDSHVNEISLLAQARRSSFQFRLGSLQGVDREQKQVILEPLLDDQGEVMVPQRQVSYDTLVLAVGSISNDFSIAGVSEHCLYLDTTPQAENFHRHLVKAYSRAFATGELVAGDVLRIAIVGAGATGVELAAQLREVSEILSSYMDPAQSQTDVHITLIEGAPRILPALPEYLSSATDEKLRAIDIEVLTGESVSEITRDSILTASGKSIACHIKVWAAGIKAPLALQQCDLEINRINQITVNQTLQTSVDENIFALGDCAACAWDDERQIPPRAQAANQQAKLLASNIRRHVAGEPMKDFVYRDYGSLVSLGRYSTVGNLMGKALIDVRIEGMMARLVYLSLYKMHQVSLFGYVRTATVTISNMFRKSVHPAIKLH